MEVLLITYYNPPPANSSTLNLNTPKLPKPDRPNDWLFIGNLLGLIGSAGDLVAGGVDSDTARRPSPGIGRGSSDREREGERGDDGSGAGKIDGGARQRLGE